MAVNIGSAVAYLELDTSKFSKGFKTAYNDLKVFSDKSATAGNKLRGLSSTFDSVGKSLTKTVTVPLVGIGTAAVKTAVRKWSLLTTCEQLNVNRMPPGLILLKALAFKRA